MNRSQHHIFISFKTEERNTARLLKEALAADGYNVWWQEAIQCGKEWHGEIDKGLENSACTIVLWSKRAMNSQWVCHEASQAIARGIYAPVRIEAIEIQSPFNRLQATDLINWDGSPNHPGFALVRERVRELVPKPLNPIQRVVGFARSRINLLVTGAIAASAIALLLQQSLNMNQQLAKQEELAVQIERTLQPLTGIRFNADFAISPALEGYKSYTERIRSAVVDPSTKALRTQLPDGIRVTWEGVNGERTISISKDSELWPSKERDWLVYFALLHIDVLVRFKKGGDLAAFANENPAKGYDLGFDIGALDPDGSKGDDEGATITWNLHDNQLGCSFSDTPSTLYWSSNGSIVSVPDFEKSFAKFSVQNLTVRNLDNKPEIASLMQARKLLSLESIWIRYSGKAILLKQREFEVNTSISGIPISYATDLAKATKLVGF